MELAERELILAALNGGQIAFESLIRAYSLRVYAVAYSVLQDREEAEDVAQDTFIRAFQAGRRLREPERFPGWLMTIARNQARDRLRRRRTVPLPQEIERLADERAGKPDEQLGAAEMHKEVHVLLATLPEQHRTALMLRYIEGLDHRAIEQSMELSNGALRGILSRALETMRKGLRLHLKPRSAALIPGCP